MGWQQLTMPLAGLDQERTEQALLDAGAVAVTYTDAADQPILEPAPGEAPLWREAIVTALFDEALAFEQIALTLMDQLQLDRLPDLQMALLADREWERAWLDDFKPMRFGARLWVCPHEQRIDDAQAVVLKLDPGLAFGTGTHATTALCLARLDAMQLEDSRVLDFGCGSGILGIAALLLGAREVIGVDIDPQALTATTNNARANRVGDRFAVMSNDAFNHSETTRFDVVLANILAGPLVELATDLTAQLKPGGRLLLSGILSAQAETVIDAYQSQIEFAEVTRQDGWVLLDGIRR